jgi:dethiobiotin synthetase
LKERLPGTIFITGIGTGVGKTIASAILVNALKADYWKPVQCGNLEHSDSHLVQSFIVNPASKVFPEQYKFKTTSSPHYAARFEGVEIKLEGFLFPATDSTLIIEGAGGLLVPLSEHLLTIDFISHFKLPVILIAQHYLGSINHTLLSLEAMKSRGINILGIIFNGRPFLDNEEVITAFSPHKILGHIDAAGEVNKTFIQTQAGKLAQSLAKHFEL